MFKIKDTYYTLNKFKLEPTTPESEPEDNEVTDLTETFEKVANLAPDDGYKTYKDTLEKFNTARKEAGEDLSKMGEAKSIKPEVAAALLGYETKLATVADLEDDEPDIEPPPEPAVPPVEPKPGNTGNSDDENGEGNDSGNSDDENGGSTTPAEASSEPLTTGDLPEGMTPETAKVVLAAYQQIKVNEKPTVNDYLPQNGGAGIIQPSGATLNRVALPEMEYDQAEFIRGVDGQIMSDERQVEKHMSETFLQMSQGLTPAGVEGGKMNSTTLGMYKTNVGDPIDETGTALTLKRGIFTKDKPRVVTASGEPCDETETRRRLPDCDNNEQSLIRRIETYTATHCELDYWRDISLDDVKNGVTLWSKERNQQMCDALETLQTLLSADPIDPTAIANQKAIVASLEKKAVTVGCIPKAPPVSPIGIAVAHNFSIEREACLPEAIRLYKRKLGLAMERSLNSFWLAMVSYFSRPYNIDLADASTPFATSQGQFDSLFALQRIVKAAKSLNLAKERRDMGNHIVVMHESLLNEIACGDRQSCDKTLLALNDYFDFPVVSIPDWEAPRDPATGMIDASQICAPGPLATLGANGQEPNLPLSQAMLDEAGGPFTAAQPAGWEKATVGTVANAGLKPPTNHRIYIYDENDFFVVGRGDVSTQARITPESALRNWFSTEMMETFVGVGKDGCRDSFYIDVFNTCFNGVRSACMLPDSC